MLNDFKLFGFYEEWLNYLNVLCAMVRDMNFLLIPEFILVTYVLVYSS